MKDYYHITKKDSIEIVKKYMDGKTLRQIAKGYKPTYEGIRQHLIKVTGYSRPTLIKSLNLNKRYWGKLNRLRKKLRLPVNVLAGRTGLSPNTVSHILTGNKRYINTLAAQKVFALIMKGVLDVSKEINKFILSENKLRNKKGENER